MEFVVVGGWVDIGDCEDASHVEGGDLNYGFVYENLGWGGEGMVTG